MTEKDIIREAIKARNINQTILAQMCGFKTQSVISQRLRGASMSVQNFVELLDAMGFDVQVRDRNSSNKDNRWTVTKAD